MSESMIRLEGVTKRYEETIAVNDLSIKIEEGEVCVLIGPSGCGKTTTLRMVNRLIEPTEGHIFINGRSTNTLKPDQLRRSIGYAIQNVGLFPHMTVARNIAVVPELLHWPKSRAKDRTEELLTLVGLDPSQYALKYPHQLSGGEAQRIGVARALAADPPILLMDEPFGAVDPLTREKLQFQFVRIQQELRKTIVLVTHDLDEAIRLANRIAVMESGKLIQYDTPEMILSRPMNKFVHDFVGSDRALKRLSRINVKKFIKPANTVNFNSSAENASSICEQCKWVWVVDDNHKLIGWVDKKALLKASSLSEAIVRGDTAEVAVTDNATLRESLSHMLGQGFRSIPVIDENERLIGEISLADIERATAQAEA